MFICELDFEGGVLHVEAEEKRRDVTRDGICVARCTVIFPQAEGGGIYASAAERFSDFYSSVADGFVNFFAENIGKRASDELTLSDARARYRFFRYECRCEFLTEAVKSDGEEQLRVSRHTVLCRRGQTLWESRDSMLWRLPSLVLAREVKRP